MRWRFKAPAPQNHPGRKIRASEGGRYKGRRNPRAQPVRLRSGQAGMAVPPVADTGLGIWYATAHETDIFD